MIEFAASAGLLKELISIVTNVIESPNTYKKLEGLRQLICKITGKEIDKNGLVALLEATGCV